jgi:Domain of unknown function (DUF4136)
VKTLAAAALSVVLALAARPSRAQEITQPKADVEYDHDVDFGSFHTFQWKDTQDRLPNPTRHTTMVTAVERELEKKGLKKAVEGTPDVRVRFYADIEKHLRGTGRQSEVPDASGDLRTSVDLEKLREGSLIIELYQGDTDRRIWRGTNTKAFRARKLDEEVIRSAVALVLRSYPPPPKP